MRYFIALFAVLLVAAAWAIDPPRPQVPAPAPPPAQVPAEIPPEPAPAGDAEQPANAPATEDDEEEETLPPLPDDVPAGPPPARFNPTEKVRADFPVSFPIDI
jgi:hypothetical protein